MEICKVSFGDLQTLCMCVFKLPKDSKPGWVRKAFYFSYLILVGGAAYKRMKEVCTGGTEKQVMGFISQSLYSRSVKLCDVKPHSGGLLGETRQQALRNPG